MEILVSKGMTAVLIISIHSEKEVMGRDIQDNSETVHCKAEAIYPYFLSCLTASTDLCQDCNAWSALLQFHCMS